MKKIFFFLMATIGLVFTACNNEEEHDDCYHINHSNDLVGTWVCFTSNYAEALVIGPDGSAVSTGVEDGEMWENVRGTIKAENNKMTMTFEDNDNYEGSFDIVPGQVFSLVDRRTGVRVTYQYCANDLSDEILGMWVCNEADDSNMAIQTYNEDGSASFTGGSPDANGYLVKNETTYNVVGDLMIRMLPEENLIEGVPQYFATRLIYAPNGTSLGDVMTQKVYIPTEDGVKESTSTFLHVNETLHLEGHKYDYNNVYVSNVNGSEEEINFMGHTLSFANMDGIRLDKMMKSLLFHIEFESTDTLAYCYHLNGQQETYKVPVVAEGNKLTVQVSKNVPTLKDVVFYAFQDVDHCQMHIYMHQSAFVNFFTNMQAMLSASVDPTFDITNQETIDAIYNSINNAVTSINLSLVMKEGI